MATPRPAGLPAGERLVFETGMLYSTYHRGARIEIRAVRQVVLGPHQRQEVQCLPVPSGSGPSASGIGMDRVQYECTGDSVRYRKDSIFLKFLLIVSYCKVLY